MKKENYNILYFHELDSTNSYALKRITELEDKVVIIASKQTSGRGRFDRKWISDREGNVYMSIILKPCSNIDHKLPLANITQYMSVILCRIIEKYSIMPEIKWPNDVFVDGRKISGILSELSIQGNKLKGLILGIGVNLNLSHDDLTRIDKPATSLNLLLDKQIDKNLFIKELLDEFFAGYNDFLERGFLSIKEEYCKKSGFIGKKVIINNNLRTQSGIAKDINENGALILISEGMQEQIITAGDLSMDF